MESGKHPFFFGPWAGRADEFLLLRWWDLGLTQSRLRLIRSSRNACEDL